MTNKEIFWWLLIYFLCLMLGVAAVAFILNYGVIDYSR